MVVTLDIEDHDALVDYLRARGSLRPDEQPEVRTLSGGVSNRVVWLRREGGLTWVFKQALEKLRVAVEWHSPPERIHREALAIHALQSLAPTGTVPDLVLEDRDHNLLAMQAAPEPNMNWKQMLLTGDLREPNVAQFGEILGSIHANSHAGASALDPEFADQRYFESLRLEPYYEYTAAQVPAASQFIGELLAETRQVRIALVHGDYSPKNILVIPGGMMLLDHEVSHFGDPAFDVGFGMTHLLSKGNHLRNRLDAFAAAASGFWRTYLVTSAADQWTSRLEERSVSHILACLLARVAGRSPLEYLDENARNDQAKVVLTLMSETPNNVENLIASFVEGLRGCR